MDLNTLRQSRVAQIFYSVIAGHRMCFRSATLSNPGSLKTVASTHFSGESRSGSSRWKTRHPDHAAVLADLNPELHGRPLGIPAGDHGEGEEHGASGRALAFRGCSLIVLAEDCNERDGQSLGPAPPRRYVRPMCGRARLSSDVSEITSPPSTRAREAARKIKGRGRRTRSKRWSIDRLIPYAKNARNRRSPLGGPVRH